MARGETSEQNARRVTSQPALRASRRIARFKKKRDEEAAELLAGIDGRNSDFAVMNAPAGFRKKASRIRVAGRRDERACVFNRARGGCRPRKWSAATCPQSGLNMTNSPSTEPLNSLERRYLPRMRKMSANVYSPSRIFAKPACIST